MVVSKLTRQSYCCSSSGIVWVETTTSPPAAGATIPPNAIYSTVFPDRCGVRH